MNPDVDFYFANESKWQDEFRRLRTIILNSRSPQIPAGLSEELKWGHPCYTIPFPEGKQKRNVVLIHGFKDYCALLFFKGFQMKDTSNILIQQTKNVQSARQIRFTGVDEIKQMESTLKTYVQQAIEVELSGLKVSLIEKGELVFPEEFKEKLYGKGSTALKTAFEALTPGRQRAYNLYFSAPKQSKTREGRIEKCIPLILAGKGLND